MRTEKAFVAIIGPIQSFLGFLAAVLLGLFIFGPRNLLMGLVANSYLFLYGLAIISFFSVISGFFLVHEAREPQSGENLI